MKNKFLLVIFLLSIIVVSGISVTFSKYQLHESDNFVYAPQDYYFESDLLTLNNTTHRLQTNVDTITIILKNYIDELNISAGDISYTISILKDDIELENKLGIITVSEKFDQITFGELVPGIYKVIATSTLPYSKTLSATFVIPELDNDLKITLTDEINSNNIKLEITNYDFLGNVTIMWPVGLVPDSTNPLFENYTDMSHTILLEHKNSSIVLLFFKTNSNKSYNATLSSNIINIIQTN